MYDSDIISGIRTALAPLGCNITLRVISNPLTPLGLSMIECVEDIAGCNKHLAVILESSEVKNEIRIMRDSLPTGITFRCAPTGNFLAPFLQALLNAAGEGLILDEGLLKEAAAISGPKHLHTCVGARNAAGPRIVQIIDEITLSNPMITNTVVEASELMKCSCLHTAKGNASHAEPIVALDNRVICDGCESAADLIRILQSC
jgi:alkyl hydroperoxide reductase subunit F